MSAPAPFAPVHDDVAALTPGRCRDGAADRTRSRAERVRRPVAVLLGACLWGVAAIPGGAGALRAGAAEPGAGEACAAPGAAVGSAAADRPVDERAIAALVQRMSLQEKVGQLFVQHVYGSEADTADPRNVPLYGVAKPSEVVAKYHLGGVIYFGWTDSLKEPAQTLALSNGLQRTAVTTGAQIPLQIATDQEQGPVVRLGPPATQLPGAMALAAGRSTSDARAAAAITGRELKALGITTNYAPDADVNANPANPVIGVRAFSSSPALVAQMVVAQTRGFQRGAGVIATTKHFPGHGDTAADSHTGLPEITHDRSMWDRIDAPPFRAAITAGVDQVMSGHLLVPALDPSGDPATLSKPIITGVLRDELGYDGVVVTDSLAMEGVRTKYGDGQVAVKAIQAGVDSLLMTPSMDLAYNSVVQAVRSGAQPMTRLDESVTRLLELKWRRGIFAKPYADPAGVDNVVGTPRHRAQADAIADRGITLVKNDVNALPLAPAGRRVFVTGFGDAAVSTLASELGRRGAQVTSQVTGSAPKPEAVAAAVATAQGADEVIVTTMNASMASGTAQRDLVAALQRTGKEVVVVSVRNPYDINVLPGVRTYLAAYSYNAVSLRAAARVLVGETTPSGTLPVAIPSADGTGILYPFGAGLTK